MSTEIVFPARLVAESSYKVHPPLRDRTIRIMPQGMSSVPAGTDSVLYSPPPVLATLQRARQAGTFFVVGAGTVDFRKGVDIFITTALAVQRGEAGRDVHFLWVGEGFRPEVPSVYSTFLHEQLERSGLQDHVTVLEAVPDLEPIYALADVLLLTSRLDPLPNVSIDAAHRGIPIVCFRNASGIADILLSDPETACGVVDHLVPGAAADAILALARNPENYNRGAVAIRSLARSTFDMATYVEALDALGTAAALAATRPDRNENSICHDIEAGHSAVLCK
jgi:glycosyltransferase involved in cell wall biosynthesis